MMLLLSILLVGSFTHIQAMDQGKSAIKDACDPLLFASLKFHIEQRKKQPKLDRMDWFAKHVQGECKQAGSEQEQLTRLFHQAVQAQDVEAVEYVTDLKMAYGKNRTTSFNMYEATGLTVVGIGAGYLLKKTLDQFRGTSS